MKAKLITRQGWERLSAELQQLWKVERPEVTRAVSEAAALGDRSENAEYIYGKKRLREIDRRVGYLSRQLEDLKIVDYSPEQEGRVFFGATVEVENEAGQVMQYRIVGSDEIEAGSQNISIDSPMARALIGKQVDDEVEVRTPSGPVIWNINAIAYER